ncbi:unnamed protein product [Gadus morhua 'NCC']
MVLLVSGAGVPVAGALCPGDGGPCVPVTGGPGVPVTGGPCVPVTGGPCVPVTGGPGVPVTGGAWCPGDGGPGVPVTGGLVSRWRGAWCPGGGGLVAVRRGPGGRAAGPREGPRRVGGDHVGVGEADGRGSAGAAPRVTSQRQLVSERSAPAACRQRLL